jgi:membrane dipeptidase
MPVLIDGHLDLAYNALKGRDLTLELEVLRTREQRQREEAMVTLPELRRAGICIVFATLFVMPRAAASDPSAQKTYTSPEEAHALAVEQLDLYERWEEQGWIRLLRWRSDLETQVQLREDAPVGVVLLMEGADPIRDPSEVEWWFNRGVRIIGPAWKGTRYAGGTSAPGPLTALGIELIKAMEQYGMILDTSHLAEESFWDALNLETTSVIASHSNARSLVNSDRHLSDAMIRALGQREGMIGLVLANNFLKEDVKRSDPEALVTLNDVRRQAEHMAKLVGWECLGIGSDFDGGFGRQETPREIDRAAHFAKLSQLAPVEAKAGLLGENWYRFLRRALPG